MQCPRCNGLIIIPTYDSNGDDPTCASCSRLYPHLKPPTPKPNGNGAKPRRGIRDTIRYTGTVESLKGTTCTISYKPHPSPSVAYPLLEISCPWCKGVAESRDSHTNPAARGYNKTGARRYTARKWASREVERDELVQARTGDNYVTCSTGHMFKLKITSDGIYSWE